MEAKILTRKFKAKIKGVEVSLEDPNPKWGTQLVKEHFANIYPEILNSTISHPEITKDSIVYEFSTNPGTKG